MPANANDVIVVGIGPGSELTTFLTFGLGIGAALAIQIYTASLYANPSPVVSLDSQPSLAVSVYANPSPDQEVKIG